MVRFSSRAIDEMGRVVLHNDIRHKLCLEAGHKVTLIVVDNIVILQRAESDAGHDCYVSHVDDIGRIDLPAELRQKLDWQVKNRIKVYSIDKLVLMKLAENYCTLQQSQNITD